jgi:flavoprotein
MIYFQVNEKCDGCLACVQNCPARALDARETGTVRTLLHNMARCARCATCWRVCPQDAIEFQHMLENGWDEIVSHELVRCRVCDAVVHTVSMNERLDGKIRELVDPLCSRHKMEKHGNLLSGRIPVGGNAK